MIYVRQAARALESPQTNILNTFRLFNLEHIYFRSSANIDGVNWDEFVEEKSLRDTEEKKNISEL